MSGWAYVVMTATFCVMFRVFLLCGCCSLWVFENRVVKRVFGPTRDEVTREWRGL